MASLRELDEGARAWQRFYHAAARQQASRRVVLKVSTAIGLLASGELSAFLAACSSSGNKGKPTGGGGTPSVAATGKWDTTGTSAYAQGVPDAQAQVPQEWQQYPWTYKYGPWRYNWNIPVSRGGHIIVPWNPASDFNVMVSGILSQPFYNKLYNAGLREGLNLISPAIEPDLALSAEHSPDYTSWTFKVPTNAKFHNLAPVNGRLLTADDVVFSFNTIRQNSVQKAQLRFVDKVTATDAATVRFDLNQPSLSFTNILASPDLVVFPPELFSDQDLFKKQPIGTGPFIMKFNEYQNRTDMARNPEYWQNPPYMPDKYGNRPLPLVDQYTRQYYANPVTAKEDFFAGKIDQLAPGGGLDTSLVREEFRQVPDAIAISNAYWSCCPLVMYFQYKNPLFQDIRIRQALSMAINREQVWSSGMDKTGAIGATPIPNDFSGYTLPPSLNTYGPNAQYDPKGAKQLLQQAGHTDPLKLQIYQSPNLPTAWQNALDTVVFNWKQAGVVDATKVVRDSVVFSQDLVQKSFPDLVFSLGLVSGYSMDTLVAPAFLSNSPANYGGLADSTLDDLINKYSLATDPNQAIQLARQMTSRIVDNVDHLWFGWIGGIEVDRHWLHGTVMSTFNQPNGIGLGNYKYIWIDQMAPGGRGGQPVVA